jgi:hypothetical protein
MIRKVLITACFATIVASQAVFMSPSAAAMAGEVGAALVDGNALSIDTSVKVDRDVLAALASGSRPDVLIHFEGKVDLEAAHRMPGGAMRSAYVFSALTSHADAVQGPARAALQAFGRSESNLTDPSGYMNLWLTNSIAVAAISEDEVETLMRTTGVRSIEIQQVFDPLPEPVRAPEPSQSLFAPIASIARIKAPDVWALGFKGAGITVGNTDSGVRHSHEALVNQYRGNLGGSFNHNHHWFDPYSFSAAPRTTGAHGTHVMGTSVGDNGGSEQIGVAPEARWIACIGFGGSGGSASTAGLIACSQFMVAPTDVGGANPNPALHAHVANNSWGGTLCNGAYDSWYDGAIDGLTAAGIVPVFAMGNASNCSLSPNPPLGQNSSPSNYGKVFSVGSSSNNTGTYATHSIKGPTVNVSPGLPNYPDHFGFANLKPQVVAPGVSIRSSTDGGDTAYQSSGWTGTSMSAPAVTGLVALMWNAAPCLTSDYATTGSLIMSTANPIPVATGSPSDGPGNIPNQATGWGEIDALAAVNAGINHCAITGGPDPVIQVSPAVVNLSADAGTSANTTMNVRNIAGGTLTWTIATAQSAGSCASPTASPWLSAAPAAGSNEAGVIVPVTVSVDASSLAIGNHTAYLCVSSNDSGGNTMVEVPVNFVATDPNAPPPFPQPYCAVPITNDVEPISRVLFNDINNLSNPAVNGSPAHEDFLSVVGTVAPGSTHAMRVEGHTGGNFVTHVAAYFDWNRDGTLNGTGESYVIGTITNSNGVDGINATANIAVPPGVTPGPVRMRLVKRYNTAPTGPCQTINWGQAEDYTVMVGGSGTIEVTPASMSFTLESGASDSDELSITNTGSGILAWTVDTAVPASSGGAGCAAPVAVSWLGVGTTSGSTAAGATSLSQITVNATGLLPGAHDALLCVNSSDSSNPRVEVPISLTVEGSPPVIDVSEASIDTAVPVGGTDARDLVIGNLGELGLTWSIDEAGPEGGEAYVQGRAGAGEGSFAQGHDRASGLQAQGPVTHVVAPAPMGGPIAGSFSEGFDDITTLAGAGWALQNLSAPLGTSGWFQSSGAPFPAHSGAPTSYIAANFNNTTGGTGTISNWLMTPEIVLRNGTELRFWTRIPAGSTWPDRLEVRLSTAGPSTNVGATATSVGDFGTVLASVNPDLVVGGFPEVWTEFVLTISGLPASTSGRIGFRYFVTSAGPTGANSNFIGIDSFSVTQPTSACDAPTDLPWLSVSPDSGVTAGSGQSTVSVQFDSAGIAVGTHHGNLCINSNDPVTPRVVLPVSMTVFVDVQVSPATLPGGTVDAAYAETITASGNGTTDPFSFAVTAGELPTGLNLASDGSLSGTPTAAGSFDFTVTATDSSDAGVGGPFSGSNAYTVVVAQASQSIDFPAIADQLMTASPLTVSATASSGLMVGFASLTPEICSVVGDQVSLDAAGTCTLRASQAGNDNYLPAGDVDQGFEVIDPTVTIAPGSLPFALIDEAYSVTFTASGDAATAPFTFAVTGGALPDGVSLDADGELSGVPTELGEFEFTVTATDNTPAGSSGPFTGSGTYILEVLETIIYIDGFEAIDPE